MKYFLLLFICFSICGCSSQQDKPINKSLNSQCLKVNYEESIKTISLSSRYAFFECFPDSFKDYKKTFSLKSELHSDYGDYLDLLFSLDTVIEIHKYCNKLIHLSIEASWNAEEINSLQRVIQYQYKRHSKEFTSCLNQISPIEKEQFFSFFFSGLYAEENWKSFPVYIQKIQCCYPAIYDVAKKHFDSLHVK